MNVSQRWRKPFLFSTLRQRRCAMAEVVVHVAGQEVTVACAPHEQRRVADLVALLESRLAVYAGEPEAMRRLVLAALALLDETQAVGAALARAREELDRLNELSGESQIEIDEPSGRVASLRRVPEGAA